MKVLLLGEFSSLHRFLKEGLIADGHQVKLISNGDHWKNIGGMDMLFPIASGSSILSTLKWLKEYEIFIDRLENYDVIQIINSTMIPALILPQCIRKLRSKCRCLSLVAAGSEYSIVKKYKEGFFDSYVYDYDKSDLELFNPKTIRGRKRINNSKLVESLVNIIIPSLYEYQVGFSESKKCWNVIPFPINVDSIEYKPNRINDRIKIYHGLIRESAKGTPFIRKAIERLNNNYPDDIEIIIKGNLPFNEYEKIMSNTNILVDQCCAYGYGINACIGLAKGKIVLSSIREETIKAFGRINSPVICIKPDVDCIYDKLEQLLHDKDSFESRGREGREYVDDLHNYKKIALRYVEAWESSM